jgi:transposase
LTPDVQKDIVQRLAVGNYIDAACLSVGISPATFYTWMDKGREAEKKPVRRRNAQERLHLEFLEAVENAQGAAEVNALTPIRLAMPEQWQAAAWILERKFPDKWGRREKIEINAAITVLKQEMYQLVLVDLVKVFDDINVIADPEERRMMYAAGAQRIIEATYREAT